MNAAIWSTKTASPPPAFWPEGAKASANSPSVVMRVPVEGNGGAMRRPTGRSSPRGSRRAFRRSEEHTSELQSLAYLVCRLLLEKKKNKELHQHGGNDEPRRRSASARSARHCAPVCT